MLKYKECDGIISYFRERQLKTLKDATTEEFELIYALKFYHKLPNRNVEEITGASFNRSTRRGEGDKILAKYGWHYPNQKDLFAVLKNHWLLFNHFIGFYLCDGRSAPLLNKSQFSLHLKKGSDEFALLMIYKKFFDILPKTYYPEAHAEIIPDESSYSYYPTNTLLAKYLAKNGFKRTREELKLPNWVYVGSKSFGALLAGVIDGDGYITCDDVGRCSIGICNTNTDFLNELDILISRYFGVTGYYSSGKLRIHPSKKKDRMGGFREFVFPQLRLERKRKKVEELNKRYSHAPKMKIGDIKRR